MFCSVFEWFCVGAVMITKVLNIVGGRTFKYTFILRESTSKTITPHA